MNEAALEELKRRIQRAFAAEAGPPSITLRGGNALDDYETPPPYDAELDRPTAEYVESFHFGIHFLDPPSWRHYLPILLTFSLAEMARGTSSAVDTFLFSLRPPDRDPPRFATLNREQRSVVTEVLEMLGFSPESRYPDDALTALQEYWLEP